MKTYYFRDDCKYSEKEYDINIAEVHKLSGILIEPMDETQKINYWYPFTELVKIDIQPDS